MLVQWGPEHEPVVEAGTERRCCLCVCVCVGGVAGVGGQLSRRQVGLEE